MSTGIVVCDNGEPDPTGYRYFGPFDGPDHARLWEQAVHRSGPVPCRYRNHWIETLEQPRPPLSVPPTDGEDR